jgi:hypothetical protein
LNIKLLTLFDKCFFIYTISAYRWFYILLYIYYLQQNLNYLCMRFRYYFFNPFYWQYVTMVFLPKNYYLL